MSPFKFGAVKIDPVAYGSQGSAVLGIRDSGKTYTATALSERLFDAGIPFVAFDPIGVWRFLRVPGEGRGYPVVVAGGQAGDLPLTVAAAPEYVRAAMRDGVSLVIDLFDINLSKADWKRIVMSCVRVLLHENSSHGLRHIFIEEAAEFCPQRVGPDKGQVYAEIEKLARMGGNARLGYTLINQRAEEVNKAVLELCDNLFLHRQKGRNSLTALSKWLDIGAVKDSKEIIDSLSTLPTGECWAWLAGSERPVRIKVPAKNSLHPDRRVMRGDGGIKAKAAVDVGTFVTSMRASLGKIEAEAEANDPKMLRKRIADLEQQLRGKPGAAPSVSREELKAAATRGFAAGHTAYAREAAKAAAAYARTAKTELHKAVETILGTPVTMPEVSASAPVSVTIHPQQPRSPATARALVELARVASKQVRGNGAGSSLPKVQQKFLVVLAQREGRATARNQVAIFAGYSSKSGHIDNTLSALRTAGYVQGSGEDIRITADGLQALGDFEPLPSGEDLRRYWLQHAGGKAESAMLGVIFEAYPDALPRNEIAERAGYSVSSGHIDNVLSRLRTLDLIIGSGSAIRASEDLFS